MRKIILSILFSFYLYVLAGCSIYPIRVVAVKGTSLEGKDDIRLIDPNDRFYPVKLMRRDDGRIWVEFEPTNPAIELTKSYRVKYHTIASFVVVEGKIGGGRKKYPIVLDTGSPVAVLLNDAHIMENRLAIYPIGISKDYSAPVGLCDFPALEIGEMTLVNLRCWYIEKHHEVQLFGLPVAHDKFIVVGLPVLQGFKYIAFDNVRKEVEFSPKELFEPEDPELWGQYPFSIEEKAEDNDGLFVKIPISGKEMNVLFDTGSGEGLMITEQIWEGMREQIPEVKFKVGNTFVAFRGSLPCQKGLVGELEVGSRIVKKAKISIFTNDNFDKGLLGMQYFRDTVVVLDFERNLMWVKNHSR